MHYDKIGRPTHQRVRHNGQTLYDKSYTWGIIFAFYERLTQ